MFKHAPFWVQPGYDRTKPVVVYGFGLFSTIFLKHLLSEGIEVKAIFDKNPDYHSTMYVNIPVLSPDMIDSFDRDCNVLIGVRAYKYTITKLFRDLGFTNIYYAEHGAEVSCIDHFIANKSENKAIIDANKHRINMARELFAEPKSIEVFDAVIDAMGNGNWERLEATCESQITIMPKDIYEPNVCEVFVECGAYEGHSIDKFMAEYKYEYAKIYAFEPNEPEYTILLRKYSNNDKVEIQGLAVCDIDGTVCFSGNNAGMGANIIEEGGERIPSTSLDVFFTQPNKKMPTMIRMDIEGAEIAALKGAKKLIHNHMPKLCISAYHRMEDYWEVPLLIAELGREPGYELYLRHYYSWYDTMCFAKPKG